MRSRLYWVVAVAAVGFIAVAAAGCKKKEAGAKGGTQGLAAVIKSADHQKLASLAREVGALAKSKKCDEAVGKAKEALVLIKRIAPGFGKIAEAGVKDKATGQYLGDLYAISATLELSTKSYAKEKGGSLDMRPHYCKAIAKDLTKVRQ